ncbi:hypothetical protein HBA55_17945 [Pseudomaricurvus alkylphenolicus]|uniref:G8 domain-containing protein n=1 Tax=Pseudomaricurvus alkylphenolicus TaxID=1306991 RepID=UPI00141E4573|nr:G8 domain-containing protein [Pseudomaricurvus alkylphenolicus]NIB41490.1 hypothetical protein [Pseudomaricurvus alkylphenolicus]
MKYIVFTLIIFFTPMMASADNESIYDPSNGTLYIPSLHIEGDPPDVIYSVDMINQGDYVFTAIDVAEYEGAELIDKNIAIYDPQADTLHIPKLVIEGGDKDEAYVVDLIEERDDQFSLSAIVDYVESDSVAGDDDANVDQRQDQPAQLLSSGNWTDESIWVNGALPTDGAEIIIPSGITLTVDGEIPSRLKRITIDGNLRFSTKVNTQLTVDTLISNHHGRLEIGSEDQPVDNDVSARIIFADFGPIDRNVDPQQLYRGAVLMGPVEIWGAEKTSWLELARHPQRNEMELLLSSEPIGWRVGDRLVVAATDVDDPSSDEVVTIAAIEGNVVYLSSPLQKDHVAFRNDLAVHVANLTRNVEFLSENADIKHRGHVMFMHNLNVDVNHARFFQLGRTDKTIPIDDYTWSGEELVREQLEGNNIRGRYSIHFHRGGTGLDSIPARVRGSVVEDNPGWAYVNHSSNVDFVDNVSYNVVGGAYQTEAGDERGSFIGNIALRTINPKDPLNCDCIEAVVDVREDRQDFAFQGDGFWLHGGMPRMEGNVVAGASGHAYIYWTEGLIETLDGETGLTKIDVAQFPNSHLLDTNGKIDVWYMPISSFKNNKAYNTTKGLEVFYLHAHHNFTVEQQWVTEEYVEQLGSTFEDLTIWNVKKYGVGFHSSEGVELKNVRLVGDGDVNKIGVDAGHFHNLVSWKFENFEIEGFGLGMDVPTQGDVLVQGGRFSNKINFRIENPQLAPRNLLFRDIQLSDSFLSSIADVVNFSLEPDFTLNAKILNGEERGSSAKHPLFFLMPDRITFDFEGYRDLGVYFDQQVPDFVPMPEENSIYKGHQVPLEFVNKSNQQLLGEHRLYFGGAFLPHNAMSIPGLVGGKVGTKAPQPTLFPPEEM